MEGSSTQNTKPNLTGIVRMIIHEEGTASIREKIRIVYNNRRSNRELKLIADGKEQPDL